MLRLAVASAGARGRVGDSSTGFLLRRNPDRLLAPDVSFVSVERLPVLPDSGFPEVVPELVAEVRSPNDSWAYLVERGGIWIAHGVRVVWLVDPKRRCVITLRPAEDPVEAGPGEAFSAEPVLPDLAIEVDRLFALLDP